jgi:nitroreductase
MEASQCICSRQSIRDYTQSEIDEETFLALLQAASRAPSAGNAQPWCFYVVRSRETIEEMKRIVVEATKDLGWERKHNDFFNAPYVICVCADTNRRFYHGDLDSGFDNPDFCSVAAAVQNLLLAAHALGIGTCWLRPGERFRGAIEGLLQIRSHHRILASVSLGYYERRPEMTARRPLQEIVKFID